MPPSTHHIENAKSCRSKCKKCKETIANGELRIVTSAYSETRDMHFISNYHTVCFVIPPRAMLGVSPEDFVEEHLEDRSNDVVLSEPTTKQEIIDAISVKQPSKKKTSSGQKKRSTKGDKSDEVECCPSTSKEAKKTKKVNSEEEQCTGGEVSGGGVAESADEKKAATATQEWVGCEACEKWRKLPDDVSPENLPEEWHCNMNTWDANLASCEAPEEEGA